MSERRVERIVVATLKPPFPPHTGEGVIAYNWVKHWAARHDVRALWVDTGGDSAEARAALKRLCSEVVTVRDHAVGRALRSWRRLDPRIPGSGARVPLNRYARALDGMLADRPADAVFVINANLVAIGRPSTALRSSVIAVPIDSMSLKLERAMRAAGPLERVRLAWDLKRWRSLNRRLLPEFDGVIAVAADDAAALRAEAPRLAPGDPTVIPNGVDTDFFQAPTGTPAEGAPKTIVFSGTMSSEQSETAVRYFLPVFRRLREQMPGLRWRIVGRSPTAFIRRLAEEVGVAVTGTVPDVRPYLSEATVCVAPQQSGAGIKNRVLEAMACGRAVVASTLAVRGLSSVGPVPLVVADSEESFANAVAALLDDAEERARLGREARQWVVSHHSWATSAEAALQSALRGST